MTKYGQPKDREKTWSPQMRKWWNSADRYGMRIKMREGGGNAGRFGPLGRPALRFNIKSNSMYLPISP